VRPSPDAWVRRGTIADAGERNRRGRGIGYGSDFRMQTPPHTRPSLLLRIRDAEDREAWTQFIDVYAPLVYRLTRRYGLQDADAADLTQDVLHAVSRSARKLEYDPERGSFRAWLFTIARNKVRNFLVRRKRRQERDGV